MKTVISIMQYRESERKLGDVLPGEYDKQRGKMAQEKEVDVQMCPRS